MPPLLSRRFNPKAVHRLLALALILIAAAQAALSADYSPETGIVRIDNVVVSSTGNVTSHYSVNLRLVGNGEALRFFPSDVASLNTTPPPFELNSQPALAVLDDKLYVVGGDSDQTHIFDLASHTWSEGAPLPGKRWLATAIAHNHRIYLVGGTTYDNPIPPTLIHDPATNDWVEASALPRQLHQPALAVLDDRLYTVGGHWPGTRLWQYSVADVYATDLDVTSWTQRASMPMALQDLAVEPFGTTLRVIGGYNYPSSTPPLSALTYDPADDLWSHGDTASSFSTYQSVARLGDNVYVFEHPASWTESEPDATNGSYRFQRHDPIQGTSETLPSPSVSADTTIYHHLFTFQDEVHLFYWDYPSGNYSEGLPRIARFDPREGQWRETYAGERRDAVDAVFDPDTASVYLPDVEVSSSGPSEHYAVELSLDADDEGFRLAALEPLDTPRPGIAYQAHVQDLGWDDWSRDGGTAGTTAQHRRLEALRIVLLATPECGVSYQAFSAGRGWGGWARNGEVAGTVGESRAIEQMRLRTIGRCSFEGAGLILSARVHIQDFGWSEWQGVGGTGDQVLGVEGKRLEAIEILTRSVPR